MDQQSNFKDFIHYTALSVLGTLGVSCYILADTFFVSKGLGTKGLAALNLAIPIYNFIHGTGLMLGMGGATKFSVCKNQGRGEELDKIYMNTLYMAAVSAFMFAAAGLIFSPPPGGPPGGGRGGVGDDGHLPAMASPLCPGIYPQ